MCSRLHNVLLSTYVWTKEILKFQRVLVLVRFSSPLLHGPFKLCDVLFSCVVQAEVPIYLYKLNGDDSIGSSESSNGSASRLHPGCKQVRAAMWHVTQQGGRLEKIPPKR